MSRIITCRTCHTEISAEAISCPKCGSPNKKKSGCLKIIAIAFGGFFALIILLAIIGGNSSSSVRTRSSANSSQSSLQQEDSWWNRPPENISPRSLAPIFNFMSDYTELQRDKKEKEIEGKVIDWTLTVYEVSKSEENIYRIHTIGDDEPSTTITLTTANQSEVDCVEALKTEHKIHIKGVIEGVSMRDIDINPARLVKPDAPKF